MRISLYLLLFSFSHLSFGQQSYQTLRDSGIRAYDALNFEDAKVQFEAAEYIAQSKKSSKQLIEISDWLKKARDGYLEAILKEKERGDLLLKELTKNQEDLANQNFQLSASNRVLRARKLPREEAGKKLRIVESIWDDYKQKDQEVPSEIKLALLEALCEQFPDKSDEPIIPLPIFEIEGHSDKVTSILVNEEKEILISTSLDSTISFTSTQGGKIERLKLDDQILGAALSQNGDLLAVLVKDSIHYFDVSTKIKTGRGHPILDPGKIDDLQKEWGIPDSNELKTITQEINLSSNYRFEISNNELFFSKDDILHFDFRGYITSYSYEKK